MPTSFDDAGTVTVSVPYFGCPSTVNRAVRSVLDQTYQNTRVVVVADGDDTCYVALDEFTDDPRLTIFSLGENHGRYYADNVVLNATPDNWFTVHDADDWSEPEWLSELVECAITRNVSAAFSPQVIHHSNYRKTEPVNPLLESDQVITRLTQLAHHAGLYRTQTLRAIGGYHPGYRIGYDTMIVCLVRLISRCAASTIPRYHRVSRPGSLTTSTRTGFGSRQRAMVKRQLCNLYQQSLTTPKSCLAAMIRQTISPDLELATDADTERLKTVLR